MAIITYVPSKAPREPRPPPQPRPAPQRAPLTEAEEKYKEARASNEALHVRERELRLAKAKQELIPRALSIKQAAFLVLSIRARLLSIPSECARELAQCGGDEQKIEEKLGSRLRSALDELVDFPERVSDPDWMLKLR